MSFAEIIVAEFHKKIKEAFEVFDHESNNTVDVRFGNFFFGYTSKLLTQVIRYKRAIFSSFYTVPWIYYAVLSIYFPCSVKGLC